MYVKAKYCLLLEHAPVLGDCASEVALEKVISLPENVCPTLYLVFRIFSFDVSVSE